MNTIDEPELHPAAFATAVMLLGRGRSDRCRAVMTSTEQQPDPPRPTTPVTATRWRAVAACFGRRRVRRAAIIYELALLTLSTSPERRRHHPPPLADRCRLHRRTGVPAPLLVKPLPALGCNRFRRGLKHCWRLVGGLSAAALYVMFSFVGGSLLDAGTWAPR